MRSIAIVATAIVALAGACGPRLDRERLSRARTVDILSIVLDRSPSEGVKPGRLCDEALARAGEALGSREADELHVLILATGAAATAHEPAVLVPWQAMTAEGRLFETPEKVAGRRQELLVGLGERCRSAMAEADAAFPTHESPIYLAVGRALESMEAHCADLARRGGACARRALAIHSDMRETVHRPLAERISAAAAGRKSLPAVEALAVGEAAIAVCGVSATQQRSRGAVTISAALLRAWSPAFGRAAPAAFDAACPRP